MAAKHLTKAAPKERLDTLLTLQGLCPTREQAQRRVLAGEVWLGEQRLEKPGLRIGVHSALEVRSRTPEFASRGGLKLSHALECFGIDVQDRVCLDVGASTGGFTDCLLKRGARRVFAVDVGFGQIDQRLREHPKVSNLEKTNARYLTQAELVGTHPQAENVSFLCADVSFISLRLLVEPLRAAVPHARDWILLFKPQFEVGPKHLGKGGRVLHPEATQAALESFDSYMLGLGFARPRAVETSPVTGKKSGNVEYLLHYETR